MVLVKLMALTIYAKSGLLRPRPLRQSRGLAVARSRPQIMASRPRTNITALELSEPKINRLQHNVKD